MKIALIGPPQSGKSTLFSAITGQPADPARMMQEQSSIIRVPDARLTYLTALYKPRKTTEATIEFWDFPGLSSADEHGRERYRKHLPHIRECDVLVAVVRAFRNDAVPAFKKRIDAQADLAAIHEDVIFADLESVSARIEKLRAALKKPSKKHDEEKRELGLLEACLSALEDLRPLSTVLRGEESAHVLRSFAFLSEKPLVGVVNVSEDQLARPPTVEQTHAQALLPVCAGVEADIAQMAPQDGAAFLADLGIKEPARDRLIQICYQSAGLISFLTTGEDEVRAWAVRRNATAVEAAARIHSDIARGFIRAETVAYDHLLAADGDMKAVKAAGRVRQEGKDYVVQDGDILHFKFNV